MTTETPCALCASPIDSVALCTDFDADCEWLEILTTNGARFECDVYPYIADWNVLLTYDRESTNFRIAVAQWPNWRTA